jgi:hypothetical protein
MMCYKGTMISITLGAVRDPLAAILPILAKVGIFRRSFLDQWSRISATGATTLTNTCCRIVADNPSLIRRFPAVMAAVPRCSLAVMAAVIPLIRNGTIG